MLIYACTGYNLYRVGEECVSPWRGGFGVASNFDELSSNSSKDYISPAGVKLLMKVKIAEGNNSMG